MFRRPSLLLALLLLAAFVGCTTRKSAPPSPSPADSARADSTARADSIAALPREMHYSRAVMKTAAVLVALRDSLGADRWRDVLRVNRVDSAHVRKGDTL